MLHTSRTNPARMKREALPRWLSTEEAGKKAVDEMKSAISS